MTLVRALLLALLMPLAAPAGATCLDLDGLGDPSGPRRVSLPRVGVLNITAVTAQGDGSFSIVTLPLLPGGGIDGRHLCGFLTMVPFRHGREIAVGSVGGDPVVMTQALLLRQGVDYRRAYPDFHDRVARSGQLSSAPPRTYVVHRFPEGRAPQLGTPAFERLLSTAGRCARTAIVTKRTVLVPDC